MFHGSGAADVEELLCPLDDGGILFLVCCRIQQILKIVAVPLAVIQDQEHVIVFQSLDLVLGGQCIEAFLIAVQILELGIGDLSEPPVLVLVSLRETDQGTTSLTRLMRF